MRGAFRRFAFAIPCGSCVAIATHFVRFGDDHAFGGGASETLVAATVGGVVAIAMLIVRAFLTGSTTTTTGTIAAARARQIIPGAPIVFFVAASLYYGIEAIEGNGIEIGLPTLVLAALAILLAYALRRSTALFALFVADLLRDWLERLERRERATRLFPSDVCPLRRGVARTARRFGRAPPNGQRFSVFAV